MSKNTEKVMETRVNRRGFLKAAAAAAVSAGAVGSQAAAALPEAEAAPQSGDAGVKGYRLTRHIADYYKTAAL